MIEPSELARVIEPYVRIHRSTDRRVAVYCPFHPVHAPGTERHPSMSIYLESGSVVCFTCGYKGWVDTFLAGRGMDPDSARKYARILRELRPVRAPTPEAEMERRIGDLSSMVGMFQANIPRNLLEAGFGVHTMDLFHVGYDTTNRRVTYPVYDRHGGLVAIVGGAIDMGTIPKYKLYEEEVGIAPGTNQRHRDHLWGFHLLPPTGPYGIVEGYKACMWVRQHGYPVVASQGVGFTAEQVETIVAAYRPVWIMYDNNLPGRMAARRLYRTLLERMGPMVDQLEYPDEDPDLQPDDLTEEELADMVGQRRERR